jgi:signal transduction histidine kinase/ActR/RegA family two-component response regulator
MPTIAAYIELLEPLCPDADCAEALTRFESQPGAQLLPIVEDDRPVGVLERDRFLSVLARAKGSAAALARPVSELMDIEPVVVEGSTQLDGLADVMLGQSEDNLRRSFVVSEGGAYKGVCSLLSLLRAEHDLRKDADLMRADVESVRANADKAIVAAAQARTGFLSLLSRELRTPMNGVVAVADLLRRQPLGPDAQAYVQTIMDSSETTLQILEDALDLARAEAGELTLDPQPVLLRQLMDDLQDIWGPRATQDGVNLMIGFEGDTELAAEVDGPRVRQVFHNLIGNALKFARNGVVEASLTASARGDMVALKARVRDNGPGIAPERIGGLFEIASAHDGSRVGGLGLPICHQVLAAMGGVIGVESNAGQGCTFVFELTAPRVAEEAAPAASSDISTLHSAEGMAQPHILIVDDNGTNRIVAQALCEMFGCTSGQAEDGVEAVEAVQSGRYDLILMDIKMPRMDGVEATRAIRDLGGDLARIPIIALTANADPEDAKRYVANGMAAVVEKPIKPERLMQAINAALSPAADKMDTAERRRVA